MKKVIIGSLFVLAMITSLHAQKSHTDILTDQTDEMSIHFED